MPPPPVILGGMMDTAELLMTAHGLLAMRARWEADLAAMDASNVHGRTIVQNRLDTTQSALDKINKKIVAKGWTAVT